MELGIFYDLFQSHPDFLVAILVIFYVPYIIWEIFKLISAKLYWQAQAFDHIEKIAEAMVSIGKTQAMLLSKVDIKPCKNYEEEEDNGQV